jgi:hypothetical protein
MRAQSRAHHASYAADHPKRVMLLAARKRARAAGVRFALSEDDFEIPDKCPVLEIPLEVGRGRPGPSDSSPTLDRIVPSLGYVAANVVVVSWRANRLKSDADISELARIVSWYRSRGERSAAPPEL